MTTRTLYPSAIRIPLPHVQQHANFTCGPAVLHSILSFYSVAGHDHSKTAAMCGSDPTDGTPPRAIAKAARQHGLNVRAENPFFYRPKKSQKKIRHFPLACPAVAGYTLIVRLK